MAHSTRMSPVDAAWLRMDRPTNPMVIVSVTILDGRCTAAAFRRVLASRLLRFDRFRCRPVADALGASWIAADDFDLRDHVGELKLDRGSTVADLQRSVGELAATPLDDARPRWRFDLVQVPGRGTAIVMRMHHCYADGIALVKVFLGMTSNAADAAPADHPAAVAEFRTAPGGSPGRSRRRDAAPEAADVLGRLASSLAGSAGSAMQDAARWYANLASDGLRAAADPAGTWEAARRGAGRALDVAGAVAGLLALPDDPPTPLRGSLGRQRRVAWAPPLPLPEVRAVAHALDATINDVLMSVVAGSLGRYLGERGADLTGLAVRAAVPVNLRPPEQPLELGNRFGLVLVDLPVGLADPLDRLHAVRASMRALKGSSQALATYAVLNALGAAPAAVEAFAIDLLSRKASAVLSNVPGPREPLFLCGRQIREMYFWVPQSGSIGVGVSILSYVDRVMFGLVADSGLVPDPSAALKGVAEEFARLEALVPRRPRRRGARPRNAQSAPRVRPARGAARQRR